MNFCNFFMKVMKVFQKIYKILNFQKNCMYFFEMTNGWMDGFRRLESSQTPARGPQFGPNVQPWKGG
jgi:hypothetical protein